MTMAQSSTTTYGTPFVSVYADRYCEPVRRWRWFPRPLRPCWWAAFRLDGVACTVVEDSKDALTDRVIEHVRFARDNDHLSVAVFWKANPS